MIKIKNILAGIGVFVILIIVSVVFESSANDPGSEFTSEISNITNFTGFYRESHLDNLSEKTLDTSYFLNVNDITYKLDGPLDGARDGDQVSISNFTLHEGTIDSASVQDIRILTKNSVESLALPKDDQQTKILKVAVLPVYFNDSKISLTKEELDKEFNEYGRNYFLEQSYGNLAVNTEVFDWIQLPRNSADKNQCDLAFFGFAGFKSSLPNSNEMDKYLLPLVGKYDRIYLVASCAENVFWGYGGFGIPSQVHDLIIAGAFGNQNQFKNEWENSGNTWFQRLITHELGHTLGLSHSLGLDCNEKSIKILPSKNCTFLEYGDPFDTMGSGAVSSSFSSASKKALGWIPINKVLKIYGPGTYTIGGLNDSNNRNLPLYAEIYSPDHKLFFNVEHRQAAGNDANIGLENANGIFVKKYLKGVGPAILDMSATNLVWAEDIENGVLSSSLKTKLGSTFVDTSGLVIDSVKIIGSTAQFRVSYPSNSCARNEPEFLGIVFSIIQNTKERVIISPNVQFYNTDSEFCSDTNISVKLTSLEDIFNKKILTSEKISSPGKDWFGFSWLSGLSTDLPPGSVHDFTIQFSWVDDNGITQWSKEQIVTFIMP